MALSKHVTHIVPRLGFPDPTPLSRHREGSSLSATRGRAEQDCGFEPWNFHQFHATAIHELLTWLTQINLNWIFVLYFYGDTLVYISV